MSIKKDEVVEFLPEYLKNNDYFLSIFDSLFDGVSNISVSKQRNGHYFYTPFQESFMDFANVSLFVSNKGISDISLEREERALFGDGSLKMKSNFLLSAIKRADDGFSITSRFVTVPLYNGDRNFKKSQFSEKREYDCYGRLISRVFNTYAPEIFEYSSSNGFSWDNDVVLEHAVSSYYLEDGAAITREYRRKFDSLDFFPQYDEHRYYVIYDGNEEKLKKEINEEEYQSYYYDVIYKNRKENKSNVKTLEKSFD